MVNWKIDNGKLNIQGIEDFEEQIEYAKSSLQYKKIEASEIILLEKQKNDQAESLQHYLFIETIEKEKSCKRNEKTIAEKDIMIKNLEDFGANEKVIRFWKPEKKWYNSTVLEKTKSGYKVVFADGNLVRVLVYRICEKRYRDEFS